MVPMIIARIFNWHPHLCKGVKVGPFYANIIGDPVFSIGAHLFCFFGIFNLEIGLGIVEVNVGLNLEDEWPIMSWYRRQKLERDAIPFEEMEHVEDWHIEEESYDCPIHGIQEGPDCPRC